MYVVGREVVGLELTMQSPPCWLRAPSWLTSVCSWARFISRMAELMLLGMSSSVAALGLGTYNSCNSRAPMMYGGFLTGPAWAPRLLRTLLTTIEFFSSAHSL